jgi:hypothetical protein
MTGHIDVQQHMIPADYARRVLDREAIVGAVR